MGKGNDRKHEWANQTIYIKETGFKGISKVMIIHIMEKSDNRPRKKNQFAKPTDMVMKTTM